MTLDAPPTRPSTIRRDLASAYVASGAKVASWAVATMLLYRFADSEQFALFTLLRGTLSFLNYTTVGLSPAIIHLMSNAAQTSTIPLGSRGQPSDESHALPYESAAEFSPDFARHQIAFSSLLLSFLMGIAGCGVAMLYAANLQHIHSLENVTIYGSLAAVRDTALLLGIGIALRLASDACGALLQASGHIAEDNAALTAADFAWIICLIMEVRADDLSATTAAGVFLLSSAGLLLMRSALIPLFLHISWPRGAYFKSDIMRYLLGFGVLVSIEQLGDYLYAPTDFILINRLLGMSQIAAYAPAVQIDAGLLLLVTAIAAVLLPKAAIAYAGGNDGRVRQYYVRGTLASAGLLFAAAIAVWAISPTIFNLWLGDPMPATQAILPLILIHTVVGGSSAVGRSILLGIGKVKPFTIAVLIAGVSNVVLSYSFVRFGGMGLNGIVLGTICAVVGRCAIWQPWYVWRCLKENPTKADPVMSS